MTMPPEKIWGDADSTQDGMLALACALESGQVVHHRRTTKPQMELHGQVLEAVKSVASENGVEVVETITNGDCGLDAILLNLQRLGLASKFSQTLQSQPGHLQSIP